MKYFISESIKLKKARVLKFCLIMLILASLVFSILVKYYTSLSQNAIIKLELEIMACIYPILIAIVCNLVWDIEEKAGDGKNIWINFNKNKIILVKILITYFLGMLVSLFIALSISFFAQVSQVRILQSILLLSLLQLPFYIFHMLLSMKDKFQASIILSSVETLVLIFASNNVFDKIWTYFPLVIPLKTTEAFFTRGYLYKNPIGIVGIYSIFVWLILLGVTKRIEI